MRINFEGFSEYVEIITGYTRIDIPILCGQLESDEVLALLLCAVNNKIEIDSEMQPDLILAILQAEDKHRRLTVINMMYTFFDRRKKLKKGVVNF